MATKKIHLIRHAESEHNVAYRLYGDKIWTDIRYKNPTLTLTGRQQVECLQRNQELYEVDEVFVSPAQRTLETARLLYPDGPLSAHDSLLEFGPGRIVNRRDDRHLLEDEWPEINLEEVSHETPTEENETDEIFKQRLKDFIRSILITDYKSVALITHHDVIRAIWQIIFPEQPFPGIHNAQYITLTVPQTW